MSILQLSVRFLSAYAEDCFIVGDCVITECGGGNSVVCELPNDGGTGKCTCATPEGRGFLVVLV